MMPASIAEFPLTVSRRFTRLTTLASVLGLAVGSLALGSTEAAAQDDAEAEAAFAVVQAFFDGMQAKDTAAIAATLTDNARLISTSTAPDGTPQMGSTEMSQFLQSVANAPVSLEEPIWDPVIQVSDRLATVWVKYVFLAGGEFSHCGVDGFQLFKSADGWKIFQIADTRRRNDCWEPPA